MFEQGGFYHVVEEKPNTAILEVMFVAAIPFMFAVMSIQYWPSWMIEKVWIGTKCFANIKGLRRLLMSEPPEAISNRKGLLSQPRLRV